MRICHSGVERGVGGIRHQSLYRLQVYSAMGNRIGLGETKVLRKINGLLSNEMKPIMNHNMSSTLLNTRFFVAQYRTVN